MSSHLKSLEGCDKELLGRLPRSLWAANGVPEPQEILDRERAAALASEALADLLRPDGARFSPLGPGWSRDVDLYLRAWPERERLEGLGWISLDSLLRRLGVPSEGMWAVVEEGRVLASLDLYVGPPPDPVASLVGRCHRRGEVRVREVLEARALVRAGRALPADDAALRLAARIEAGLGGEDLASLKDGPPLDAPAPLARSALRSGPARARLALSPRLVVAVSGVDGAGKSTLSGLLTENLRRADVPVGRIWSRPGMRLKSLYGLSRAAKKLLRQEDSWGMGRIAEGVPSGELASRRGVVGWVWTLLVVLMFLLDAYKQHVRGRGVLVYDRHLLDALATLDFAYEGVNLRVHKALVRRFLPKPSLSVYLDTPVDLALARKPGDVFGEYAVRRQLASYQAHRGEVVENLLILDGSRPPDELAEAVIHHLARR